MAQGGLSMESIHSHPAVHYSETKPGGERLPAKPGTPAKYDPQPRGASRISITHQDNDRLTLERASARCGGFPLCRDNDQQKGRGVHNSLVEPAELIKVAIVDDDDEMRFLLRQILEQSRQYKCVGSHVSGEEALRDVPVIGPRMVLMDIRMAGISGIECMRRLRVILPWLIVVFVSRLPDLETMAEALAAGGDGYLAKPFAIAQCLATLTVALRRRGSCTREDDEVNLPASGRGCGCARLTDRELEVMRYFAKGLFYKEIAEELGIRFSTVHNHAQHIFRKFHVCNRTEAINKWRELGGA